MEQHQIEVRLFAYLRDGRGKQVYLSVENVRQILDRLNIADEDAYIVLINGRDGTRDSALEAGDVVSLFPQVGGG